MSQKITIRSESQMLEFGQKLAAHLTPPAVLELVGDVGTGKTTLTRGLAAGLGVQTPVTSPSFTISKIYPSTSGFLIHYDFYRLADPGLMAADLAESISDPTATVVIEWGESVASLLPPAHQKITLTRNPDDTRTLTLANFPKNLTPDATADASAPADVAPSTSSNDATANTLTPEAAA